MEGANFGLSSTTKCEAPCWAIAVGILTGILSSSFFSGTAGAEGGVWGPPCFWFLDPAKRLLILAIKMSSNSSSLAKGPEAFLVFAKYESSAAVCGLEEGLIVFP